MSHRKGIRAKKRNNDEGNERVLPAATKLQSSRVRERQNVQQLRLGPPPYVSTARCFHVVEWAAMDGDPRMDAIVDGRGQLPDEEAELVEQVCTYMEKGWPVPKSPLWESFWEQRNFVVLETPTPYRVARRFASCGWLAPQTVTTLLQRLCAYISPETEMAELFAVLKSLCCSHFGQGAAQQIFTDETVCMEVREFCREGLLLRMQNNGWDTMRIHFLDTGPASFPFEELSPLNITHDNVNAGWFNFLPVAGIETRALEWLLSGGPAFHNRWYSQASQTGGLAYVGLLRKFVEQQRQAGVL